MEAQSRERPMRIGVVVVAALMVGAGAQAQQSWPPLTKVPPMKSGLQDQIRNLSEADSAKACPGALRAQHQATSGAMVWTVAQEDKGPDGQARQVKGPGLHVMFDGKTDKVKALELSVSYLPAGTRVMPIAPGTDSTSAKESTKTFVLQQEAAQKVDADLLIGRVATITRVHLVSATFADGSVWHASSEDACSIAPSLYMPVEAKK